MAQASPPAAAPGWSRADEEAELPPEELPLAELLVPDSETEDELEVALPRQLAASPQQERQQHSTAPAPDRQPAPQVHVQPVQQQRQQPAPLQPEQQHRLAPPLQQQVEQQHQTSDERSPPAQQRLQQQQQQLLPKHCQLPKQQQRQQQQQQPKRGLLQISRSSAGGQPAPSRTREHAAPVPSLSQAAAPAAATPASVAAASSTAAAEDALHSPAASWALPEPQPTSSGGSSVASLGAASPGVSPSHSACHVQRPAGSDLSQQQLQAQGQQQQPRTVRDWSEDDISSDDDEFPSPPAGRPPTGRAPSCSACFPTCWGQAAPACLPCRMNPSPTATARPSPGSPPAPLPVHIHSSLHLSHQPRPASPPAPLPVHTQASAAPPGAAASPV